MPGAPCRPNWKRSRKSLEKPQRPLVAIVGGAKISTKLDLLGHLLQKVDVLVIGGAMANTFLLAQGQKVGKSLVEAGMLDAAKKIMAEAKSAGREIVLPVDVVVAEKFEAHAPSRAVEIGQIGDNDMILDIGPRSIEQAVSVLARIKTLVWNGPFGAFEMEPFDHGTDRGGGSRGGTHRGRQACFGGGRRRHGGRAQCRRRDRSIHLCVDRRRRLPGMAGRQAAAGGRGVATTVMPTIIPASVAGG